jgi:restriction endonuclease S subunit
LALLEGLEISEVNFVDLERTIRIDSEFYRTVNLNFLSTIIEKKPKSLAEFVDVSDGNHLSISDHFCEDGIPYYRGGDIYNFYIEQTTDPLRIPEEVFNIGNMRRSHLKKGDVLISIVGAIIGNLSLVKTDSKATCSCKLAILRPKAIKPELLAIYLKSKFGQNQVQKFRRGTGQTGLILEDFDQLLIPDFSVPFAGYIETLVTNSYELLESSQNLYMQAENLLLETLGLKDFEPSKEPVNIKGFKESFGNSGRLDAEYYQKKYEQVVERIKSTNYEILSTLVKIKKSIEPGSDAYSDEGLPFIRVSDFNKFGLSEPDKKLSFSFYNENKEKLNKLKPNKETILFSKDGSVGAAYMLRNNVDFVTSGAILHLTVKDKKAIIPEYLTLALNSKLVQMQAERDAGGSIILHWRVGEIENVVVPLIDYQIQKEIAKLVNESFRLKTQSEQLLELAKTAVEKAIEENEKEAMLYIKAKLKELN